MLSGHLERLGETLWFDQEWADSMVQVATQTPDPNSLLEALLRQPEDAFYGMAALTARCIGEIRRTSPPAQAVVRPETVDATLEKLLALTRSPSANDRRRGAVGLGWLGGERAVQRLVEVLDDRDRGVHTSATRALGATGDLSAVDPLLKLLASPSVHFEQDLPAAISDLGDHAVDGLLGLVRDGHASSPEAVVQALGATGSPRAAPVLIELATAAPTLQSRTEAVRALGRLGDPAAVDFLIGLLDEDGQIGATAVFALAGIGGSRARLAIKGDLVDERPRMREACIRALKRLDDAHAIESLTEIASTDPDAGVRWTAVYNLQELGAAVALEALLDLAGDHSAAVRCLAARGLASASGDGVVTALLQLAADADEEVRCVAAEAIGATGDPRCLETLARLLDEEDQQERGAITTTEERGLPSEPTLKYIEPLVSRIWPATYLRTSTQLCGAPAVRACAAQALGVLGDPRALPALIAHLNDKHPIVRTYAADALGVIGDALTLEPLLEQLEHTSPAVRACTVRALGAIEDPRALHPVLERLGDRDGDVEINAVTRWADLGTSAPSSHCSTWWGQGTSGLYRWASSDPPPTEVCSSSRRSSWPTGGPSTTTTVPTPPWGCSPQPSSLGDGGPTSRSSHSGWTDDWGPVTETSAWHIEAEIWSTNPLERVNKEIKRRTNVVGIFPNAAGVVRLAGSILLEVHDEWKAAERRYLSEASMAKLSEIDNHGADDKEVRTKTKELLAS